MKKYNKTNPNPWLSIILILSILLLVYFICQFKHQN